MFITIRILWFCAANGLYFLNFMYKITQNVHGYKAVPDYNENLCPIASHEVNSIAQLMYCNQFAVRNFKSGSNGG